MSSGERLKDSKRCYLRYKRKVELLVRQLECERDQLLVAAKYKSIKIKSLKQGYGIEILRLDNVDAIDETYRIIGLETDPDALPVRLEMNNKKIDTLQARISQVVNQQQSKNE